MSKINCPSCGKEINSQANFCEYCGKNLKRSHNFFDTFKGLFSLGNKYKKCYEYFISIKGNIKNSLSFFYKSLYIDSSDKEDFRRSKKDYYNTCCRVKEYYDISKISLSADEIELISDFINIYENLDEEVKNHNNMYINNLHNEFKRNKYKYIEFLDNSKINFSNYNLIDQNIIKYYKNEYELVNKLILYENSENYSLGSDKTIIYEFKETYDNLNEVFNKIKDITFLFNDFKNHKNHILEFINTFSENKISYKQKVSDNIKADFKEDYKISKSLLSYESSKVIDLSDNYNIIQQFILLYDNFDQIKNNINEEVAKRKNILKKFKDNRFNILNFNKSFGKDCTHDDYVDLKVKDEFKDLYDLVNNLLSLKNFEEFISSNDIKIINEFGRLYSNIDSIIEKINEEVYNNSLINEFNGLKESISSFLLKYQENISYNEIIDHNCKEEFKDDFDFISNFLECDSAVKLVSFQDLKLMKDFLKLYSNFDNLIDEINVEVKRRKSILRDFESNKDLILDFIDSYTDNISYDQVVSVDIKEDYKKEYDLTCLLLSFESSDDFDLGENKEIIHKFHDLYNNFDHIIDEINVEVKRRKSILRDFESNKDLILDFIDSYTDNISYDQVVSVDIKEDYKKEYDLTCLLLSFESSDDFDLGENKEIIHKFHDLYNNFDHIIDEINVEVKRRKSILDKLKKNKNNILNFIDCYMLNVSDELYIDDYQSILDENKYLYDICRDSEEIFDYKCITDFLNLYDRFESNAMFINEDYCDRKLDIFYDCENEIIEEIEKYENMDVDSYIKNRNDFLAKYKSINSLLSELLDLYEENDFKLDDDEFKTINSFIEIYDNINNYPEIKYAYFKENVLDRIELFVNKYSNVKECNKYIENKDNILNNFSDCFDFTNDILKLNNENDLKIKNKEKTSCNNFLTTYTNFDDYVLKNNLCYIKKIREKFDKENRKISAFVDKYDSNTIFNKFISKKEKKQILKKNKENYILISQMVKIDEIDNTPLMNDFMQIYENFDNIIFNFNKNYILNIYNQYEDDILVYSNIVKGQQDFYVSNRMLNKLIPKYDDILNIVKKLLDYCSQDNYLDNKENIEVFPKNLDVFTDSIKNANKKYVQREIINNKDFFDNIVPDKPLDDDQRKAVVTDEENTQIIAGAGSGKTLTLQAKAKYLIDKKHVDPSKILAISFSNASKNDLEYKMNEIDAPIDVKTFHSWGYEILKDCKYENSSFNKNSSNNLEVDEYALKKSIKKYFKNKILKDKIKMQKILEFFAYYIYEPLDKTKIDKIGEIYDYERGYDLKTFKEKFYKLRDPSLEKTTFKGETVKSLEERMIANFLFINGINYTYEKAWQPKYDWQETFDFCDKYIFEDLNLFDYFVIDDLDIFNELFSKYPNISDKWELNLPIDFKNYSIEGLLNFLNIDKVIYWPSGDEVVRNYNPDFYLNDYDIYLEHFGVNKKGFAPWLSRSASKTYHEEMINKKNLHKKYGTKLIETYSYYHSENRLLYCLEKILKEQGVDFKQVDYSNYFKKLLANESKISEYYDFIKLIESFINLFKGNDYKLDEFKVFRKINKENYAGFTYDRHELFFDLAEDIYQYYCQYLKDKNLIDFNDMINIANNYIKDNGYYKNYQYILVDEFQDTSHTRFNFLKSIKEATNAKLIIVGDDWQSIYSFTGCDIDLFTNFEKNINLKTEICYINNIYRYSQDLINVSSSFIMDNDKQIKKELTSKSNNLIKDSIKLYQYSNDELQPFIFEQIIKDILKSSNSKFVEILVLGRTNNDYKKIINEKLFYTQGIPAKKNFRIIYRKNPNIDIEYLTVHKSKGLERDNVVIINLEDKKNGFPNKMEDDSILSFVNIEINESMEFAEERRLFYVALTRTKERTYLLAPKDKKSIFVKEIMDDIDIVDVQLDNSDDFISDKAQVILSTEGFCPECGTGIINAIYNPKTNNKFYGCSNFPKCKWRGGNYLEDKELLKNPIKCDKCGGLIVKRVNSKDQTEFYACINYFSDKNCRRKYSKYRHSFY